MGSDEIGVEGTGLGSPWLRYSKERIRCIFARRQFDRAKNILLLSGLIGDKMRQDGEMHS